MARINVIGQSGTGKSYYAGYLLEQIVPNVDYGVHFDIENEERGLSDTNEAVQPIYNEAHITPAKARKLDWKKTLYNHRKLRVVPEDMSMAEMRDLYSVLCHTVMRLCQRVTPDKTGFVSCDEAHNVVTQHHFDQRVERMITGGRKHGVECLHISQRPQLLHTTVISQSDRRIYFRISDSNDLDKIGKMSNFPIKKLKDLNDREFIGENKSTGKWEQDSSNNYQRINPHLSGDDGVADEFLPV